MKLQTFFFLYLLRDPGLTKPINSHGFITSGVEFELCYGKATNFGSCQSLTKIRPNKKKIPVFRVTQPYLNPADLDLHCFSSTQ